MVKQTAARLNILPENEEAALAYLSVRGYEPARIERNVDGLTVLIFPPLTDDALDALLRATPAHLSAKIGIVGNDTSLSSSR